MLCMNSHSMKWYRYSYRYRPQLQSLKLKNCCHKYSVLDYLIQTPATECLPLRYINGEISWELPDSARIQRSLLNYDSVSKSVQFLRFIFFSYSPLLLLYLWYPQWHWRVYLYRLFTRKYFRKKVGRKIDWIPGLYFFFFKSLCNLFRFLLIIEHCRRCYRAINNLGRLKVPQKHN